MILFDPYVIQYEENGFLRTLAFNETVVKCIFSVELTEYCGTDWFVYLLMNDVNPLQIKEYHSFCAIILDEHTKWLTEKPLAITDLQMWLFLQKQSLNI